MTSTPTGNTLANAASAYLRSAGHQPVAWQEWGAEALALARSAGKPILLDIGAVWCHWCHVMDRESYENPEIAALINELFIPIKVDRDERPDVDARYQAAVSAISGQGGWPLTAFLTPDGRPYFGGTYFPPEERYGRPGFPRVLHSMAHAYAESREEVEETAASVLLAIEGNETFTNRADAPGHELLSTLIESILRQFDPRNGGFGQQPKFPHPGALDLLIDSATRRDNPDQARRAAEAVRTTLQKMAAGGVYDQLGGGFHRYSVDEHWRVPHFEKLAYDNAELLRVYTHAFQTFVDPAFARHAADILRWMDEWLSDRERGGFYASQDADDSIDDDGDYFTWTRDEVRAVLSDEQFAVAELYFNLRAVGDMQHNPAKNVLHLGKPVEEIAAQLAKPVDVVRPLVSEIKRKLYTTRHERRTPFVDRTIYTGWNALCIAGYLAAGRALNLPEATAFALRSLDRVLAVAWTPADGAQPGLVTRVISYGDAAGAPPSRKLPGGLEDYSWLANSALDAWEATGEPRYFAAAEGLADAILIRFHDHQGGFFDTEAAPDALGALTARRKPMQDAPTPSGNGAAATLLLRLHALTGREDLRAKAVETLEAFAGVVEHFGLYAGSYALALRRHIEPPMQVSIVGEGSAADALAATATARFAVEKSILRLRSDQLASLPASLAETLPHLPRIDSADALAIVCKGSTCFAPITQPNDLLTALNGA